MKELRITNYELRINKKGITIAVILALFLFFSAHSVSAWTWGQRILPQCSVSNYNGATVTVTNPCDTCDLFLLIKNLVDFVTLGVVPVVGTLLFIVGGFFILLGAASPGMVQRGKSIMWSTTMGIVIILTAWLITNTLIVSLIGGSVSGFNPANWFTIQDCAQFGKLGMGGGTTYGQSSYGNYSQSTYGYSQSSYGGNGAYQDASLICYSDFTNCNNSAAGGCVACSSACVDGADCTINTYAQSAYGTKSYDCDPAGDCVDCSTGNCPSSGGAYSVSDCYLTCPNQQGGYGYQDSTYACFKDSADCQANSADSPSCKACSSTCTYTADCSTECIHIAGTGLTNVVFVASNISPDFFGVTCAETWTSADMGSNGVFSQQLFTNNFGDILNQFPPFSNANLSLWMSDVVNSNACTNTTVRVDISRCNDPLYRGYAQPANAYIKLDSLSGVTVLAHELGHIFLLSDEYPEKAPNGDDLPPSGTNGGNCKNSGSCPGEVNNICNVSNYCPRGLTPCYDGCNLQYPGKGWYRDSLGDLMYNSNASYNQFGPVDKQILQSYGF